MAYVFHDINKYDGDTVNLTVFLLNFKALYYSWPEKKYYFNFISKYSFATRVEKLIPWMLSYLVCRN